MPLPPNWLAGITPSHRGVRGTTAALGRHEPSVLCVSPDCAAPVRVQFVLAGTLDEEAALPLVLQYLVSPTAALAQHTPCQHICTLIRCQCRQQTAPSRCLACPLASLRPLRAWLQGGIPEPSPPPPRFERDTLTQLPFEFPEGVIRCALAPPLLSAALQVRPDLERL